MVANIGARLWQLGEWILPSSGCIPISKSPSPNPGRPFISPLSLTSLPTPVSLADSRLFLISNGLIKFILHWYVPELH